jgi:hypothetical protein
LNNWDRCKYFIRQKEKEKELFEAQCRGRSQRLISFFSSSF